MNRLNRMILLVLVSLTTGALHAQYEKLGGIYYAYPAAATTLAEPPQGYEPFYLSHYGRHGSRWLTSDKRYEWVNQHFADKKNLTKLGKSVRRRLARIWKNAKGNGGQLTPLGARQHRAIAGRMYANFPQLFTSASRLTARSSTVGRCKSSMESFVAELKSLNPSIVLTPETNEADMSWIAYTSPEMKALELRTNPSLEVSTDRFVGALFLDPSKVPNPSKLLTELHTIASDMQDVELDISLYDIFTPEELEAVYRMNNTRMTLCNGNEVQNEGIPARSAISLWLQIEKEAEAAIADGGKAVDLRFGHDTNLYRLLTLMGIDTRGKGMDEILPMAANLQMVFYRNAEDSVLVQLLYNEQSLGFMPWTELKQQVAGRMHQLEHLRQLSALNTMVGTAPANTQTAGMFGKGSEEHGQTLPAVLVPNGQTFWTPQTRDTEKKCVAPYYYTDSLLQGIRASHWLVGGCTQDYGSFTVAALGGDIRLKPEARATRFSHEGETSHPYYYRVVLPDEHLVLELTGLSHSAQLRVTPLADGPVHIVVNTNSDEREGAVELDADNRLLYGFNPVHRIYQGWGEPAGFSGHFVMEYSDEMVESRVFEQGIGLTFEGRRGQPMVLKMATSFTSRQGALRNLQAEDATFDQAMQRNREAWTARFHTIDVEDGDTAHVNQFYGALYRASFLPREMSDVDGAYPRFADGTAVSAATNAAKRYGDFSLWDTYRALHPLLNIIAPEESGQMMQSLVGMYEEGGWLPIFPCWNSYTAAMIGDHASSVLADAYVKGIRGFDAVKAYEAMRKNALKKPDSIDEYRNGMGRRALDSYMNYGYIPLEDSVKDAFHTEEQTSRTLEYAYDDFCVAQMAKALGRDADYNLLMQRSENWRHVINPVSGYADGRHADGSWEGNTDLVNRKPYITEGATCHYTWYVPQNVEGLMALMGGKEAFSSRLDSMFVPLTAPGSAKPRVRYWHGNEPCHQVAWLFAWAGHPEKTRQYVDHILRTEYNDTPGGLSGNDDAGQMSAWQVFASMGFYPVCPGTSRYVVGSPQFQRVTINRPGGQPFIIERNPSAPDRLFLEHEEIVGGGLLLLK